jgi:DNA-binding transcriptional MerR regulator
VGISGIGLLRRSGVGGGAMTAVREKAARYPIRAVSKLTGIAIDTLRAWERRYGAVTPRRDDRGRVYTDADVARLRLLQRAVSSGHSVGRVATLSDKALQRLATAQMEAAVTSTASPAPRAALPTSSFTAALLTLDSAAIDHEFARLAAALPPVALIRDVLLQAVREVGDNWERQPGGIAHEHLISSTLRHLLGSFLRMYSRRDLPVRLLFATPSGDRHEIGILSAAMLAASSGLGVSYVGPDLPAGEIVRAVHSADARVLVLGMTLRDKRKPRERELRTIVRDLPPTVELWAGGPGAERYASLLGPRGVVLKDFDSYLVHLTRLGNHAS